MPAESALLVTHPFTSPNICLLTHSAPVAQTQRVPQSRGNERPDLGAALPEPETGSAYLIPDGACPWTNPLD